MISYSKIKDTVHAVWANSQGRQPCYFLFFHHHVRLFSLPVETVRHIWIPSRLRDLFLSPETAVDKNCFLLSLPA